MSPRRGPKNRMGCTVADSAILSMRIPRAAIVLLDLAADRRGLTRVAFLREVIYRAIGGDQLVALTSTAPSPQEPK